MKNATLIILLVFSIFSNVQAGGIYRTYNYVSIDVFEQTFNFYYKALDDTVKYLNKKGKEKSEKATVNVVFYDINKGWLIIFFVYYLIH